LKLLSIIFWTVALVMFFVGFAAGNNHYGCLPEEPVIQTEKPVTLSRPQSCAHLSLEPDPETWNPVTEEYPPNDEWEECMGVGRR